MILDKIRVFKSIKTSSKNPLTKSECTSVGAGYDWSSLGGGEGKITWKLIANKSKVEKNKKI
jgi:hypothetical protein